MRMVAVVLGGGAGSRFGASQPKQLLRLGGRTLIEHCVAAFERAPGVDEIVVVMAAGYLDQVRELLAGAGTARGKLGAVIAGGTSRPESVRAALAVIERDSPDPAGTGVLIHDAARPLVSQDTIAGCVTALASHQAAGTAVPSSDTIVIAEDGVMRRVPPRETIWRAQTPQAFRLPVIIQAHRLAAADPGFTATDDCGVVLRYLPAVPVRIVPGSERNLKVTYPQDLAIAEALLAR